MSALLLAVNACHANHPSPPERHGSLIAYGTSRSTPWFQPGDVTFTLAQHATTIAKWTKQIGSRRFASASAPSFTTDGKYAFARYSDEQAGRYPYDGEDIHAALVWVDTATRQVRDVAIPAQSRSGRQEPARPNTPFPLRGSVVVWQAPTATDPAGGHITLMQLDLSQPRPTPGVLRTIDLPPRPADPRRPPVNEQYFTGNVVGAGHGRIVLYHADHLFLTDTDGAVHDLGQPPGYYVTNATFSPDGTRFAVESGKSAESGHCTEHQAIVFDAATGLPAADFPHGAFDLTPRPYFYGNTSGALWWTPEGTLRATGSADVCPASPSEPTADGGVWELGGSAWTQVDPAGTYRDYPLPGGDAVVVAQADRPADERRPNEPSTVTKLFIRERGTLVPVGKVEAALVAVGPP